MKCPDCEGYGYLLGAAPDRGNPKCDRCNGTGEIAKFAPEATAEPKRNSAGAVFDPQPATPCPLCRGRCQVPNPPTGTDSPEMVPCPRCAGSGEYVPVLSPPGAAYLGLPPGSLVAGKARHVEQPDGTYLVTREFTYVPAEVAEASAGAAPAKKKPHPWLRKELWEKCPACNGTRETRAPMMVDRLQRKGADGKPETLLGKPIVYTGRLPEGSPCPLCEPHGFIEVGLTTGQVERFRAMNDVLLEVVARVAAMTEGTHNDRDLILNSLAAEALAKCGNEGKAALASARRQS